MEWSCSVFLYLYPYFLLSNFYQYHQGCNSFGFLRPLKMIVNIKVECIVTILILLQIDDPSQGKRTTIFWTILNKVSRCNMSAADIPNKKSPLSPNQMSPKMRFLIPSPIVTRRTRTSSLWVFQCVFATVCNIWTKQAKTYYFATTRIKRRKVDVSEEIQ